MRGRRIPVPKGDVRPTSERARQAYFDIVADRIHDARFLDLFAGSGIFSFEAISRGALEAVAVDIGRQNVVAIEKAAAELNANVRVIGSDAVAAVRKRLGREPFDLVYADPPYAFEGYDELLLALDDAPLADEVLVAIEHRRNHDPFTVTPVRLRFHRRAEYGEVWMTFFSRATD
jgi:16S rRNA (guanine966-N2)-methyltransferase